MSELDFERDFWGPACKNTYNEETKQLKYLELMGFVPTPTWRTKHSYDVGGRSIVDIGGGPCSVLLKFENLGRGLVVDPTPYPDWVERRYLAASISWARIPAESMGWAGEFDLALVYNCLQHTQDPEKIIANARRAAKELRMCEWIDIPPHEGHPHMLTKEALNKWTGRKGRVVELHGENECYGRLWVLGPPCLHPVSIDTFPAHCGVCGEELSL